MIDNRVLLDRRGMLRCIALAGGGACLSRRDQAFAATGGVALAWQMLNAPILAHFFRAEPQGRYSLDGMVGLNMIKKTLVEEQRLGTEWVIRGLIAERSDWYARGWQMLDIGVGWQMSNGGFQPGYFHSNSLFIESLARACLLDPDKGHMKRYRDCVRRGLDWLADPKNSTLGKQQNAPYTHRNYILAACFGQGGALFGDAEYARISREYARVGLARQRADGVNPELGGFDVSYQMAGLLSALRYYPYADGATQVALRRMIRKACDYELQFVSPSGEIGTQGSTRANKEVASGVLKEPNYPEIFQTFAYADMIMPKADWRRAAYNLAVYKKLPLVPRASVLVNE